MSTKQCKWCKRYYESAYSNSLDPFDGYCSPRCEQEQKGAGRIDTEATRAGMELLVALVCSLAALVASLFRPLLQRERFPFSVWYSQIMEQQYWRYIRGWGWPVDEYRLLRTALEVLAWVAWGFVWIPIAYVFSRKDIGTQSPSKGTQRMNEQWYYVHAGIQEGPVTEAQFREKISLGQLLPNDLVWRGGMAEWVQAGTVAELVPAKSALPPPPSTPRQPQPSTSVPQGDTPTAVSKQPAQTTRSTGATPTGGVSVGSPSVKEWHYAHGGVQKGPVTEAQLKALITLGQLLQNDLVWRDGMAEWVKAGTVRELFPAKPALPPPPPPPTPKRPQSPTAATAAPVPNQSPQTTGSAVPTPTQPDPSSADWRHQIQNPLVIGLSFLFCWPVGLVLIGIHPRISRKTKRIVFGCFASFIVIAMIITGIASSVAYKQVLEANALWEKGKQEEAVAIYKSLVAGESGGMLSDSMKPAVYGRLIDYEASLGNVALATKWIEQADRFNVAPDVRSEEAQRLVLSFEEEKRQKEQLAQTRTETKSPAAKLTSIKLIGSLQYPLSALPSAQYAPIVKAIHDRDATTTAHLLANVEPYSLFTNEEIAEIARPVKLHKPATEEVESVNRDFVFLVHSWDDVTSPFTLYASFYRKHRNDKWTEWYRAMTGFTGTVIQEEKALWFSKRETNNHTARLDRLVFRFEGFEADIEGGSPNDIYVRGEGGVEVEIKFAYEKNAISSVRWHFPMQKRELEVKMEQGRNGRLAFRRLEKPETFYMEHDLYKITYNEDRTYVISDGR